MNWLSKWFNLLFSDQRGFIRLMRAEGDDPNDPSDPNDPQDPEEPQDPEDPSDPFSGYDDETVAAYLKEKKGVDVEFEKLPGLSKSHGELTRAHDTTVKGQKAMRIALEKQGLNADSLLAEGMELLTGEKSDSKRFAGNEPPHLTKYTPDARNQIESTQNYYFAKNMEAAMPAIVKGILKAIDGRDLDKEEADYEASNEDYATHKEAVKAHRDKHGITSRSKETREMVLKTVMADAKSSIEALAGNEDKALKKKLRGAPPPGGGNRKPGDKGELAIDKHRKRWEKAHPDG